VSVARRYFYAAWLAAVIALPETVGAWDRISDVASALPSDFVPSNIARPSGYWVVGTAPSLGAVSLHALSRALSGDAELPGV